MAKIHIMALRHSAFYTPFLMTMAGGYLRKQGLEPVYSVLTPDRTVVDEMRAGRCDLSQSAVATSFAKLEQGIPPDIVHFAQINARDGFFIAARDADANFDWQQLRGRSVLVDHFFQPHAMLRYALHLKGMSLDELNVIDAGDVNSIETAFREGQGDYVHMQGPAPQQMEAENVAQVVASVGEVIGPVAFSSLCCRREWLETDMAQVFLDCYRQAMHEVCSSDAESIAAKLQAYGFLADIKPEVLAATIRAYQQLGCWEDSITISPTSFERCLDVFEFAGVIHRRYEYDSVIVPCA